MSEFAGIVTLTTDFGASSPYVAQMKGVLLSLARHLLLVDVTHGIPPQAVRVGAITLDDVCWQFTPGSIHVAVVDPGVGSERAILLAAIDGHWFIAPDNGLLSLVARNRAARFWELANPEYWRDGVSATFHGRDIMAPTAAHLALGVPPDVLGRPRSQPVMLDWPAVTLQPGCCTGAVLMIDSFGNVVTNIRAADLAAAGEMKRVEVACRELRVAGIVRNYAAREPGATVALIGSSGRLEIAVVNGNAARELGLEVDDPIVVRWEP